MSNSNYKIALIIPYFGSWPCYFNIYLKGCENNKWLDVIFFTDCEIPNKHLDNITFIPFTLKKFNINNSYKLCDFKPCYSLIFEDYLKDYDYWAYGDIDLIYGDLKSFIFNRIDAGFDVLSNRSEILSGSLSFFRNTNFIKNLFTQSPVFIDLLFSQDYKGLDETAHNHINWQGGDKLDLPPQCFTYIIANENKKGTIKASFASTCKEKIDGDEKINYQNGLVFFGENSLAYYHYVCNKNRSEYRLPNWQDVPTNFFITKTGFYKIDKFYWLIHYYRKISGFIINISIRLWKRLIKS